MLPCRSTTATRRNRSATRRRRQGSRESSTGNSTANRDRPDKTFTSSSSRSGEMKFDDLDQKMRVFETAHDLCALPGLYMVARLDGRSFTRLTKEVQPFEAP